MAAKPPSTFSTWAVMKLDSGERLNPSCVMNGKTWAHGSTIAITIKTPDGKSTTTTYTCKNGTWVA